MKYVIAALVLIDVGLNQGESDKGAKQSAAVGGYQSTIKSAVGAK